MRSYWIRGPLLSLLKEDHVRHRDIGRRPWGGKGRNWSYVAVSRGMPKIANKPPEAGKRQGRAANRTQRGHGACFLDLELPEL